ncbi:MAG: hypothetical protein RBQ66_08315 [Candidatus Cloacimonadaceae bacterium]|jgi:hypothetical protein|nr:hypothetical protein [Candidatus Cloacimonadaceae bacterium]
MEKILTMVFGFGCLNVQINSAFSLHFPDSGMDIAHSLIVDADA